MSQDLILRNPAVSIFLRLLELLDIRFSRREVRQYLSSFPDFPQLSLADLADALDHWGISHDALRIANTQLSIMPIPALISLREADEKSLFALLVAITPETAILEHPVLQTTQMPHEDLFERWNGIALCPSRPSKRLISSASAIASERELNTEYDRSIRLIDEVLSKEMCCRLISLCEEMRLFDRSEVITSSTASVHSRELAQTRTSASAHLTTDHSPIVGQLGERAASILRVPPTALEDVQCARYRPSEQFRPHFDAGVSAPRRRTLLIYLNEDFQGGETVFPETGRRVRPRAGAGLLFRNLNDKLELIPQSLHAGLPVLSGVKYVCNVWAR